MQNFIKDITEIASGYSFRGKVEHNPKGEIAVIQLKDLVNDYSEIGDELTRIDDKKIKARYLISNGDVLFISKGANNYAVVFRKDLRAVAASAFFVLRVDESEVLPEYLAWYINQRKAQRYFEENSAGTYIPNVNKTTLEKLKVEVPEKKLQEKIVKIDFLRKREYLLMNELIAKRKELISDQLLKSIK